jgi:hypothetical protein
LTNRETILYHKGPVKYDTVSQLIRHLQDEFDRRELSITVYKKVLVVMIEMLENIYKYCDENCMDSKLNDRLLPEIVIEQLADIFYIRAGNPVVKADSISLKQRIETINALDKEELLELYKQTITNGRFSKKGGAGLGLMEIARIANDIISYSFDPLDPDHDYYTINASVK